LQLPARCSSESEAFLAARRPHPTPSLGYSPADELKAKLAEVAAGDEGRQPEQPMLEEPISTPAVAKGVHDQGARRRSDDPFFS